MTMELPQLPACRWRLGRLGPAKWQCANPKLMAPFGVADVHCLACPPQVREYAGAGEAPVPPMPPAVAAAAGPMPGVQVEHAEGFEVRVWHCVPRKMYDWSVVGPDGRAAATGTEARLREARREAWTAAEDLIAAAAPAGPAILLTGGIGDVFAVESVMTPAERGALESIYYACPAAAVVRGVWEALPNYPRLARHVVLPTGRQTFLSRKAVTMHGFRVPPGTQDWSIGTIFPQRRPHAGSSFLAHRLFDAPRLPPGPFVAVQPASSWGQWSDRDFNAADWRVLLAFLDARGLFGVVLNEHGSPLPDHPRLIGWQGVTSMRESIEILKAAQGYVGIDSCLSVLAAQLFPAARLAVKGTRSHVYDCAANYYAPHATFPFLRPALEAPPWT